MALKNIVSVSFDFLYFFGIMYPDFTSWQVTAIYILRVSFLMGFFFGGIMLAELANFYFSLGDLSELTKSIFLTLINLVSIYKYYVIWKNQKRLLALSEMINRPEFRPQTSRQEEILENYVKLSKMISIFMYTGCTATCTFWAIYPFTESYGPFLPIAAYVPFETANSTLFGFVYAYEIVATAIGGITDLSCDCLIASLIMVICAQLNILNDTLANIKKFAEIELKKYRYFNKDEMDADLEKLMNQKLIECVIHHRYIMEFAEEWTSLFSTSIFGQFLVSIFAICTTLFEISQVSFTSIRFFSMALYQCCLTSEIFPACYFGNEVIIESHKLTNSAYHCYWMDSSLKFRKNLLSLMTGSQRDLELTAGGYFTLSLDTFIKILNSSYSYLAVLLQMNNK